MKRLLGIILTLLGIPLLIISILLFGGLFIVVVVVFVLIVGILAILAIPFNFILGKKMDITLEELSKERESKDEKESF